MEINSIQDLIVFKEGYHFTTSYKVSISELQRLPSVMEYNSKTNQIISFEPDIDKEKSNQEETFKHWIVRSINVDEFKKGFVDVPILLSLYPLSILKKKLTD
jgi:hypothetical protein